MRFRTVTLSVLALTFGMGVIGGTAANAGQSPSTDPGMPGMNMSGMSGSAAAAAAPMPKGDLNSNIARARQKPVFLEARLAGANEVQVPGKPPVGDPKGSATGIIRLQGDRITFAFSWQGISAPTLGHIHQGVAGVNGNVVVPLFATPMPANVSAAAGAVTVSDPKIADELRGDPAGFYLNLHDAAFPGGAVRGQLTRLNHPVDVLNLLQGGGERAYLSGDQEIPNPDGSAVGDPTGRAVAFIRPKHTEVRFAVAWVGLLPTAGHIHSGRFGVDGPVVVPLWTTAMPSTIFAVSGTVTGVDPALVKNIAAHPAAFYTNLHTERFPGGAARGQLFGRS